MSSEQATTAGEPPAPESSEARQRSLDRRLAGGIAWTAGAKWVTQIFSWASLVIVAHKLSPADYGISEMAGVSFILTNTLAEFGVGTAVLHMPELEQEALDQLHGFSLITCTGVYLASLLASPLIARFFHASDLIPLLAVNNLSFFITGFQAVPLGLLQRDMDYRRLSVSEATMYLVQAVVTVVLALTGFGYWSLVLGVVVGKATNAALVCWWKPLSFHFPRRQKIQAPLELGRHAVIGQLAWSGYMHCDGMVIGRILGEATLGIYRMAMNLAAAPAEKISLLIMRTAGPLFANVQGDFVLVRRYFLILADTLALVVVPAMVGLIMVAPEAVQLVLGEKWLGSVTPLRWLAVYMIAVTMSTLVGQVLVSQRLMKFTMRMSLLNCAVVPVALTIGAYWKGIAGVAAAWMISSPVNFVPMALKLFRLIGLRWSEFFYTLLPAFVSAAAMGIVLNQLRSLIAGRGWPLATMLGIEVTVGSLVYTLMFLLFFRNKLTRYVRFLQSLRRGSADIAGAAAAEGAAR